MSLIPKKKVVALVPIKRNNERVPGKNTKALCDGTPLIRLILRALLGAQSVDEIYVYCSDEGIRQFLLPGVRYLKRDEKYDTAQADVNDMFYAFSKAVPADIYVLAHATAPFLKSESIDAAVAAVASEAYDSAIAVRKLQEFLWSDGAPVNYDTKKIPRTQDLAPLYTETTGMYVFTRAVIRDRRSRIGEHPYLLEVSAIEATDINNPDDFAIADAIYGALFSEAGKRTNLLRRFREKLAKGDCVYGPFMKTGDPMFVEAVGLSGFDFAILDMEHGPVQLQEQQNNIRAAALRGLLPIVRVKDSDENTIGSVLDAGALGVQVPQIKNAEQAQNVVRHARFFPYGMRGVCRFVRAAEYTALDRKDYFAASKDLLVILQLEGAEAIANLDEILGVKGIDLLFIGPYDLSQSLGVPGEVGHPKVIAAMREIVAKAKKAGIAVGTFTDDLSALQFWRAAGIQYLSYNVDIGIFMEGCKQVMKTITESKETKSVGGGYTDRIASLSSGRRAVAA